MGNDSNPVCFRCAQIKQACNGEIPCARCTRLQLPCRSRTDDPGSAQDFVGSLPKAQIRRVQTGCAVCKKRKKKCDEVKPRCGDCRRLCLECVWPEEKPPKRQRPPTSSSATISSGSSKGSSTGSLSPSYRQNSASLPVRKSPKMEPEPKWTPVSEEDLMWDSSQSDTRQSDSKMSSDTGSFALCKVQQKTDWWLYEDASSLSVYMPQIMPQLGSSEDRALMNHYSTIVSGLLSRKTSVNNPYNHHLLPMASSNGMVLHCLLALSANHWRRTQPQLAARGIYHQSKATMALAKMLPDIEKGSGDIALVGSLLLCMSDFFDGTSEGWKLHLAGAKKLLLNLKNQQGDKMSGRSKFLVRLARFLDSSSTTSTCKPPLLAEEEEAAETMERLTAAPDEEDSALYGVPKQLFDLIDRINEIASKRATRVDAESEAAFRKDAAQAEDEINIWSAHNRRRTMEKKPETPLEKDVLFATVAYEYAIRLRLHQIVEGYELLPPIPGLVRGILDAIQRIRYGSPLETSLIYPLTMAGGACSSYEDRLIVSDRLLVMERTCGFGYVYNARVLMEKVWKARDEATPTSKPVNWAEIRYTQMHGLVIF